MAKQVILIAMLAFILDLLAALPLTMSTRAISSDLLNQLSFFGQYAAAAYCPANNSPGSDPQITCDTDICPLVQQAEAQSIVEFENVGISDATGFVSLDHTNKLIVVSFRGSRSVRNFIGNLNFVLAPWSICSGCTAHLGFLDSWMSARSVVLEAVTSAKESNPNYQVVSTGHSLGGALATLAAADLRESGHDVELYTYGSPMAGNSLLALFITGQSSANFRVSHLQDVVPKLPGYAFGYAHISPEYWITSPSNAPVTENDIQVSTGVINFKGNSGTLGNSVEDHLWYFDSISGCGGEGLEIFKV